MLTIVLLRGINVGGNKKVPMPELCSLAAKLGFTQVQSYINSGNLILGAGKKRPDQVEAQLEKTIEKHFGFHVEVIARTAKAWKIISENAPFPSAQKNRPKFLHLGVSKQPCQPGAVALLMSKAMHGEQIKLVGEALWIDFAKSVGKSKITPALIDRAAGSPVTLRNWNTVLKINELLSES